MLKQDWGTLSLSLPIRTDDHLAKSIDMIPASVGATSFLLVPLSRLFQFIAGHPYLKYIKDNISKQSYVKDLDEVGSQETDI